MPPGSARCLLYLGMATIMLLEDTSSRGLSSVDFGKAAQRANAVPKGIALPPPTEFIHSPVEILDTEAAVLEAHREKQSLVWRARLKLRRVSDIAKELAIRTLELLPKPSEPEELPELEISREIDLDEDDQADTARVPTPVPFPAERGASERPEAPKSKPRKSSKEWEVTTQVVDMTRRRVGKGTRPGSLVPVHDLVLEDEKG